MDIFILLTATFLILLFKSNIIKIHLVIFFYPVWVMYLTKNGVYIPGIISAIGLDYYEQYVSTAFWWSLLGGLTIIATLWGKRNTIIKYNTILIDEKSRIALVIFTIITAAVFLPQAFFLSGKRFNLFPFFAWGALYNVMSIFLVITHQNFKKLSSLLHLLLLVFIMARGERADQIMVLLSLVLFTGDKIKSEIRINLKYMIAGVFLFLLVSFIGFVRIIGMDRFLDNFSYYVGLSFYAQQTATDVTHVYMSSVYYYFEHSFNIGALLNLPLSLFPGLPGGGTTASNNFINLLKTVVPSYGGGLFYAEAALNFGLFGVIFYCMALAVIIRTSIMCNSLIKKIIVFTLLILIFRVHWYGFLFIIKPIYISFILIVLLSMLSRSFKKKLINESSNCS